MLFWYSNLYSGTSFKNEICGADSSVCVNRSLCNQVLLTLWAMEVGHGSDFSRFNVISTCYWINYKLNESQKVNTKSIQEVVKYYTKITKTNHSTIQ